MAVQTETTWQQDLAASARRASAGVVGGFIAGILVGGVGGRLAMFILRLTSRPSLAGLETDDGFIIGRFSGETLFLVIVTAGFGLLGGLFFLAVRGWLPERSRMVLAAVFGAIVGGAAVIHPDGVDFNLLDPLPLAIALFVALPALYGVAMSWLVERLLRSDSVLARSRVWFAALIPLIPLALTGPVGLVILVVLFGLWAIHRAVPGLGPVMRSIPMMWLGRVALLTVTLLAFRSLVEDVRRIL
jgi:hypothetical protein